MSTENLTFFLKKVFFLHTYLKNESRRLYFLIIMLYLSHIIFQYLMCSELNSVRLYMLFSSNRKMMMCLEVNKYVGRSCLRIESEREGEWLVRSATFIHWKDWFV